MEDQTLLANIPEMIKGLLLVIGGFSAISIWFKTNNPKRGEIWNLFVKFLDVMSLQVMENSNEKK